MGKTVRCLIALLLASLVVLGWQWAAWHFSPAGKACNALDRSRSLDRDSLARFESEAKVRIFALNRNIDGFVDELSGLTLVWKTMTLRKDEYIEALWEKHFGKEIERTLIIGLEGLISDLCAHHNNLIVEVSAETGAIMLDTAVKFRLEEDFHAVFNRLAEPHARKAGNLLVEGQVVAAIAGMIAGGAVQQVLKKTWVGMIVVLITDLTVSSAIEDKVKETCRLKVKNALDETANSLLYGGNGSPGLFPVLEAQLDRLYEARREIILSAVEESAPVAGQ